MIIYQFVLLVSIVPLFVRPQLCCNETIHNGTCSNEDPRGRTIALIAAFTPFALIVLCCVVQACREGCRGQRQIDQFLYSNDDRADEGTSSHPSSKHLAPFRGSYHIGEQFHSQPFMMMLQFDYSVYPRRVYGEGSCEAQPFVVSGGVFTIDRNTRFHRCSFVQKFNDGSARVLYGQCEDPALLKYRGQWIMQDGSQQGKFSFEPITSADHLVVPAAAAVEVADEIWRAASENGDQCAFMVDLAQCYIQLQSYLRFPVHVEAVRATWDAQRSGQALMQSLMKRRNRGRKATMSRAEQACPTVTEEQLRSRRLSHTRTYSAAAAVTTV